jgi:hypothetical protein
MSKVSQTTREGDITRKFRHLLDVTLKEFKIFKKNNRKDVTMDDFLENIPLGVIYKDHILEPGTDFNLLLDHFNCSTKTRECVAIELGQLPEGLRWQDAIFQASIRGREDLVKILYKRHPREVYYRYYSASKRLVDLFVKNEKAYVEKLVEIEIPDKYAYAINEIDSKDEFREFIFLVTCFQEQDVFRKYYLKYNNSIPKRIESILRDVSLKYNIDRYDDRLDLY